MKITKEKMFGLSCIVIAAVALAVVTDAPYGVALALTGSFVAAVITVFMPASSDSPAEFLILTYLYR